MKPRPDPKAGMAAAGDVLFGRRLRSLREDAGLTQQQLADLMREFARVLGIDLTQLLNVGQRRLVTAQLKVTSLEHQAEEYARRLHETQVLLDDTLTTLEDARAQLKEREAEQ